ncbi:MAG: J domain-containing protein [Aeriscardovia sp.]|nr:J domain-containing protein [Aeriscardovia sp.]
MTIPEWSNKDFYATLGVSQDAGEEEIGKAYKELARKYHPDVNPDPEAAVKFKQITEAYDVLSTPDQRKLYDTVRKYFTF